MPLMKKNHLRHRQPSCSSTAYRRQPAIIPGYRCLTGATKPPCLKPDQTLLDPVITVLTYRTGDLAHGLIYPTTLRIKRDQLNNTVSILNLQLVKPSHAKKIFFNLTAPHPPQESIPDWGVAIRGKYGQYKVPVQ